MERSSGIGLTGFGIVLVVVGAVMRFAISAHTHGFTIHTAGVILLWVGIAIFVLSLLLIALGSRSRSTTRTDVRETPSGDEERIERQNEFRRP